MAIDHDEDAIELGQDGERVARDELRVLKRDLGWEQRVRHTARLIPATTV